MIPSTTSCALKCRDHRAQRCPELVEVADTVTEMRKVKHIHDRG